MDFQVFTVLGSSYWCGWEHVHLGKGLIIGLTVLLEWLSASPFFLLALPHIILSCPHIEVKYLKMWNYSVGQENSFQPNT